MLFIRIFIYLTGTSTFHNIFFFLLLRPPSGDNTNKKVLMILQFGAHTTASLQLPSPFFLLMLLS
jgi:hypothetical protein